MTQTNLFGSGGGTLSEIHLRLLQGTAVAECYHFPSGILAHDPVVSAT